jgi:hypothetical protein
MRAKKNYNPEAIQQQRRISTAIDPGSYHSLVEEAKRRGLTVYLVVQEMIEERFPAPAQKEERQTP